MCSLVGILKQKNRKIPMILDIESWLRWQLVIFPILSMFKKNQCDFQLSIGFIVKNFYQIWLTP